MIFQIPFIFNFFWSIRNGEKTGANPWDATTIESAAPSPRRTAISSRRRKRTGVRTGTAFPARPRTFPQHEA